jgi:hypothetical protein
LEAYLSLEAISFIEDGRERTGTELGNENMILDIFLLAFDDLFIKSTLVNLRRAILPERHVLPRDKSMQ